MQRCSLEGILNLPIRKITNIARRLLPGLNYEKNVGEQYFSNILSGGEKRREEVHGAVLKDLKRTCGYSVILPAFPSG